MGDSRQDQRSQAGSDYGAPLDPYETRISRLCRRVGVDAEPNDPRYDTTKFDTPIFDPEEDKAEHKNVYVLQAMDRYRMQEAHSHELFSAFQDDFELWTTQSIWADILPALRMKLKALLRKRGVYLPNRGRIQVALANLAAWQPSNGEDEDMPPWPEHEETNYDEVYIRFLERVPRNAPKPTLQRAPAAIPSNIPTAMLQSNPPADPGAAVTPKEQPFPTPGPPPAPPGPPHRPGQEGTRGPSPDPRGGAHGLRPGGWVHSQQWQRQDNNQQLNQQLEPNDWDERVHRPHPHEQPHGQPRGQFNTPIPNPYQTLPPLEYRNEPLEQSTVINFGKSWDKTQNYTGNAYDVLDTKTRAFLAECEILSIPPGNFAALFRRILSGRAQDFALNHLPTELTFRELYQFLKDHFDTEVNQSEYYNDWSTISYLDMRAAPENRGKPAVEVMQVMLDKLSLCQRALGPQYSGPKHILDAAVRACRGVPELRQALFRRPTSFEALSSDLRASLRTAETQELVPTQYYADRRYEKAGNRQPRSRGTEGAAKACWICKKPGCWSNKHTAEEQRNHREKWKQQQGRERKSYKAFLVDFEGTDDEGDSGLEESKEEERQGDYTQNIAWATFLQDKAFEHRLTSAPLSECKDRSMEPTSTSQFQLSAYDQETFQGIMPDTGAAGASTAGQAQFKALQRWLPGISLDATRAGEIAVTFGIGERQTSLGATTVQTPIGTFDFHVMPTATPFLLCLKDMDRANAHFDNTANAIVKHLPDGRELREPVVRKMGHAWFFLQGPEAATAFLNEAEMRRLHRRFGHPSVARLHDLLTRAGHDVERQALTEINKFCHHCQIKGSSPQRFRFSLPEDRDFNYEVIIDVVYLEGKPVLHVVDEATAFNAARFLPSMTARDTWDCFKACWIDTYLGPPDIIKHDPGTNFAAVEFQQDAKLFGIQCRTTPVEAHWAVGKVERYHGPLRRAFEIITAELSASAPAEHRLQMACKAVNDTAGPDGLVPTLLVFGAYPRMTQDSPPSGSTFKRAKAVQKAMTALRKVQAERKVATALAATRGPTTTDLLPEKLPIGSMVLVLREKGSWRGPYPVIATTGTEVTVDMVNGPTTFSATKVKPYYQRDNEPVPIAEDSINSDVPEPFEYPVPQQPRRRGRPRREPAQLIGDQIVVAFFAMVGEQAFVTQAEEEVFLSKKEAIDMELALKLRAEGKITTKGAPFELSDDREIKALFDEGVLVPELFDLAKHGGVRIFKSRLVREIKGKMDVPFEKSRLVIQGYNDLGKKEVLTQSPTIQRSSQRTIFALAPTLLEMGMSLELRDITMAYTQSKTDLGRLILAHLPTQLKEKYPEGTILWVKRPLYGVAEAGAHWFATYFDHHCESLGMEPSSHDPCLLATKNGTAETFGMTGLQTDDTLNLGTRVFMEREEEELQKAGFKAKPRTLLGADATDFNGCRIRIQNGNLIVTPKGQGDRLEPVDGKDDYVVQRARGAYIASICQPEAAFDYSVAAQFQDPGPDEVKALNKRIAWQMENKEKGLRYIPLDLATAKLLVFVDGSFANNKDLSSQIGFVIVLANEQQDDANAVIKLRGNLIHWSSTKCKRVTRSVLASEIYGMVAGFDLGFVINDTLRKVVAQLGLPPIPMVLCTDSFSLYECLVKLGTTAEKRLMIDIMALRQSYEKREVHTVRWINGEDNLADAMTKGTPNAALTRFVDTNEAEIRVEGWVQR